MKNEILTERTNLFEPYAYIGFAVTLSGMVAGKQVEDAVHKAAI